MSNRPDIQFALSHLSNKPGWVSSENPWVDVFSRIGQFDYPNGAG